MSDSDTRNTNEHADSKEETIGKGKRGEIECLCFDPTGKEAEILDTILQNEHDVKYQRKLGLWFILVGVLAYLLLMLAEPATMAVKLHYNFFKVDFWQWSNLQWFVPVITPMAFGFFLRYTAANDTLDWWYRVKEKEMRLSLGPTRQVNLMITIVVMAGIGVTALLFTL